MGKAAASSNPFLETLAARQSRRLLPEATAQSRQAWSEDSYSEVTDEYEADDALGSETEETDTTEEAAQDEGEEEGNEYEEYNEEREETDSPMVVDTSSKTWPAFNFPEAIGRLERAAVKERKKSLKKPKKQRSCPRHPDDQRYIDFLEKNRQDTVSLANDGFSDMTAQMKRMADKTGKQADDLNRLTKQLEKQTADMAFLREKLSSLEKMASVSQASPL